MSKTELVEFIAAEADLSKAAAAKALDAAKNVVSFKAGSKLKDSVN